MFPEASGESPVSRGPGGSAHGRCRLEWSRAARQSIFVPHPSCFGPEFVQDCFPSPVVRRSQIDRSCGWAGARIPHGRIPRAFVRTGHRAVLAAVLCGLLLGTAGSPFATAAETGSVAVSLSEIRIGIGGVLKAGHWAEASVQVEGLSGSPAVLQLTAVDAEGQSALFTGTEVSATAGGRATLRCLFLVGRLERPLLLEVLQDGKTVFSQSLRPVESQNTPAVWKVAGPGDVLVASAGKPGGLTGPDGGDTEPPLRHLPLNSLLELPTAPAGYESLDALVLAAPVADETGGEEDGRAYALDAERNAALKSWVASGGHLILSVASKSADYSESRLAEWVPIQVAAEPTAHRDLAGLESFARRNELIVIRGEVPAARIEQHAGRVLISGLDGPLLVQAAYGLGCVSVVGLDLNRAPLRDWTPLTDVVRRLILASQFDRETEQAAAGAQLTRAGISDLKTQWHASQEWFPNVDRPSTWAVMGLIALYVLLIGPLDWLIVHRLLRRPRLTWITFPLLILLAASVAWWFGDARNSQPFSMNQYDVIDIDGGLEELRGRTWASVYSPESRRYAISAAPAAWETAGTQAAETGTAGQVTAVEPLRLAWSGVPETGYGGMYRGGGLSLANAAYHISTAAGSIGDLPVPVWSTRSVRADWKTNAAGLVESELTSTGSGQLSGTFRHRLPVDIEDWVIAFDRRAYLPLSRDPESPASRIRPGQTWSPNLGTVRQRELGGFLTGTRATRVEGKSKVDETIRISQEEYEPLNREPADIIRVLTFHEVTGGVSYTGLTNHELRKLDLTKLLSLNRAVLFGRLRMQASRITVDGEQIAPSRQAAFVRIILPVRQTGPERRELPDLDD